MALRLVKQAAWMSTRMVGRTLAANGVARALHAHSLDGAGGIERTQIALPRALAAARAAFDRFSSYLPKPHCAPTKPRQHGRPTPAPTAWSDDTCKSIFRSHWPPLARTRDR